MGAVAAVNGALRRLPVWPFYVFGFAPAAIYFWLAVQNRLGADPVRVLEHETGMIALQLLIASLAVTPLRELTGISLLRFRRMLGLMAFAYAALHLAVWLAFDRQFDWPRIGEDLARRPYVILGMTAFALLAPLAATSWNGAIRRMGAPAWRRLHRLSYAAVVFGVLHFVWVLKVLSLEAALYLFLVLAVLSYRVVSVLRKKVSHG